MTLFTAQVTNAKTNIRCNSAVFYITSVSGGGLWSSVELVRPGGWEAGSRSQRGVVDLPRTMSFINGRRTDVWAHSTQRLRRECSPEHTVIAVCLFPRFVHQCTFRSAVCVEPGVSVSGSGLHGVTPPVWLQMEILSSLGLTGGTNVEAHEGGYQRSGQRSLPGLKRTDLNVGEAGNLPWLTRFCSFSMPDPLPLHTFYTSWVFSSHVSVFFGCRLLFFVRSALFFFVLLYTMDSIALLALGLTSYLSPAAKRRRWVMFFCLCLCVC